MPPLLTDAHDHARNPLIPETSQGAIHAGGHRGTFHLGRPRLRTAPAGGPQDGWDCRCMSCCVGRPSRCIAMQESRRSSRGSSCDSRWIAPRTLATIMGSNLILSIVIDALRNEFAC